MVSRFARIYFYFLFKKKFFSEKQTLNIYVNGNLVQAENIFGEDGAEMKFELGSKNAVIKATTADKKHGIIHELFVDGKEVAADFF